MEHKTTEELQKSVQQLDRIQRQDLDYNAVAGRQIMSALLREVGVRFAEGYLYQVLQGVANEARRRGLLINPNPFNRQTYSTAVGNADRMMPSLQGWEQTKGIFSRHLHDARSYLVGILRQRKAELVALPPDRETGSRLSAPT